MPPARPPKRPSDADDVPPDDVSAPKLKLTRLERGPEDFSNVVKNKLQSYTRTGQACDRCKVRASQEWLSACFGWPSFRLPFPVSRPPSSIRRG